MFIQKILLLIALISGIHTAEDQVIDNLNDPSLRNISGPKQNKNPKQEWSFENYVKKFEPATIWERIDRKKKYEGLNITDEEQTEMMIKGIDPFDEVMNMRVENGDPKLILQRDGRRGWKAPTKANTDKEDRFYLRRRLYELMKQVIYQTRNKMVVMQVNREGLKNSSLYKMGFLMSRIDNLVKTYTMFSIRALKGCTLTITELFIKNPTYDILSANERQISLLFNLELLVELVRRNDKKCRRLFKRHKLNRKEQFNMVFEN